MSKIMKLDLSKTAKKFSVKSSREFLHQYQACRVASTWPLVFLSQIFRYFPAYQVILENINCTFHFMYHSKVFRRQVSFFTSWQLVSVKLSQCFMQIRQLIFQFAHSVRKLWVLRTLFLGKTGLVVKVVAGWCLFAIFDPTWKHNLA